ncbi:MAG: RhuM family protein [Rectinemataceae bacterium]
MISSSTIDAFGEFEAEGWEERTLGELFEITSSKRVFESDWKPEGIPFYRAREIVKLAKIGFVDNELFISREMYRSYANRYIVRKEDVSVAKNYLDEDELKILNRIVNLYLEFAELQAMDRRPMEGAGRPCPPIMCLSIRIRGSRSSRPRRIHRR